jgi:hypothetical protein
VKDGWIITHDPLKLAWASKRFYVDLGAERMLAAEKKGRKIAVEIKSFQGTSEIEDLRNALGQYILYLDLLAESEPDRDLFLAVSATTYREVFEESVGQLLIGNKRLRVLVFDHEEEVIVQWVT